MPKLFLILLLLTQCIIAKVDVTNLATYMIEHTNYEGTTGPGFFINTSELQKVSDIMKDRLGIQDISKIQNNNYPNESSNNLNTTNTGITKNIEPTKQKEEFQYTVVKFNSEYKPDTEKITTTSFSEITINTTKKNKKVSI